MNEQIDKVFREIDTRWIKQRESIIYLSLSPKQTYVLGFLDALRYITEEQIKHQRPIQKKKEKSK